MFLHFLLPEAMGKLCRSGAMGTSGAKQDCTEAEELQNLERTEVENFCRRKICSSYRR